MILAKLQKFNGGSSWKSIENIENIRRVVRVPIATVVAEPDYMAIPNLCFYRAAWNAVAI